MVSYKDAGVDVAKKEAAIANIKKSVESTFTSDVVSTATTFKFGGTISLKRFKDYDDPVMVVSTDGVGTKMAVAELVGRYDTVGVDILNHSINDVLTSGAKPLFFLDYVASAQLDSEKLAQIVTGIAHACKQHNIILAGGETAEMPGTYVPGAYDIAGTIAGVVERSKLIDGSKIVEGDVLIGLASTGLHTNGYSLARKILFEDAKLDAHATIDGLDEPLGDALLRVHREYASVVLPLIEKELLHGIAHITGGGFPGNVPRILPPGLGASINRTSWNVPALFELIQKRGNVDRDEMYRAFNMGIGLVLVVDKNDVDQVLEQLGEGVIIGNVISGSGVTYADH